MLGKLKRSEHPKVVIMSVDDPHKKNSKKNVESSIASERSHNFSKKKFLPKIVKWNSIIHHNKLKLNTFDVNKCNDDIFTQRKSKHHRRGDIWPKSDIIKEKEKA